MKNGTGNEFLEFALERLRIGCEPRAQAMFGGHGVYDGERMFAIVLDGALYLKADDSSRVEFESAGMAPFTYIAKGRTLELSYYEAPPGVFEDSDSTLRWVRLALNAASRSQKPRASKRR